MTDSAPDDSGLFPAQRTGPGGGWALISPERPEKDKVGLELLAALEEVGGIVDHGLFLPPDLPWDAYEAIGSMLGELHKSAAFLIGDWLNYGEFTYGHKYAQAAALTGLSEQTCANYQSVANRVPPSRRRYGVSFTKHAEVASLPPNEQRHWLKVAAEEGLTRAELRERLRPLKGLPPAGRSITCPHCGRSIDL